ncbi:hypothetical protein ACWF62_13585 [Rhodococcus sp. NPDC054953]
MTTFVVEPTSADVDGVVDRDFPDFWYRGVMSLLLGMAGIVGFVVALDRVGVWAEKWGWIHWRRMGGGNGAAGLFNAAQELITPSTRHAVEEQHRLQTTRLTHSADGSPFSLDPDRGVIYLHRSATSPANDTNPRREQAGRDAGTDLDQSPIHSWRVDAAAEEALHRRADTAGSQVDLSRNNVFRHDEARN